MTVTANATQQTPGQHPHRKLVARARPATLERLGRGGVGHVPEAEGRSRAHVDAPLGRHATME